jgi:methionine-rich copper-binding protein CopC/uncharacterized ubiquitin-like protein YukD
MAEFCGRPQEIVIFHQPIRITLATYQSSLRTYMTTLTDSGNTQLNANNLGDKTYDVATLGILTQHEISETVGAEDTADYFKFSVTQANALYLDLSATTLTKFQILNSAGSALGTLSAGASSGSYQYMLNLDQGTYYLKAATADSTERASYIVKTLFAPTDTQTDTLAVSSYSAPTVKLGNLGTNGTITQTATAFDAFGIYGQNIYDKYTFTLTADAKVKFDLSPLKNAGYISLNISSQNGSSVGSLSIDGYGTDTSSVEKQLLTGTYTIDVRGYGATKYDSANGTSGTAPTKYQLQLTANASDVNIADSGNTQLNANNLGDKTYDVATLGILTQHEISETVGAEDTADYFKFSVTQANALYLDLSATTLTKFQILNSAGSALGTLSAGASSGSYQYMLNLDQGTYYLKAATADSTERASYIVKTLFAPTDTQTDTLAVSSYSAPTVKLGNLGTNGTITQTATAFDAFGIYGQNIYDKYTFTLTADAKVKFDLSPLKNAGYISLNISSQNGSSVGSLSIDGYGTDTSSVEKQLLTGTYTIDVRGYGATKYDSANGTSGTAPTKYQLQLTANASDVNIADSGNTQLNANNLGDKTYDVATLGILTQHEISETVGAEDTADYFKFSVTQANALYLDLSATTLTKFQILNSAGSALGTLSAGASSGSYQYMLNLDQGTYYLKAATADSTERASYIVKTLFAPTDTQTDTLAVSSYSAPTVKLGNLGTNGTITQTATAFDAFGIYGQNIYDKYTFTLTADAKVKFDLSPLKNAGYISLNISSQNGSSVGSLSIDGYGTDTSSVEKQLLTGTYTIDVRGYGATKYDSANGTSGTAPTKYQLQLITGTGQAADTLAPTITTFSPADEATDVAIASNIVLTFNEAITHGTGNIILKTTAGVTVATYDAATSSNLSISGSTLTINPTADLAAGTAYKVEFAPGSVKDLAGNAFAGTTSYNFTTVANATTPEPTPAPTPSPTLTKDAQFVVLQPGSPAIVGAGTGDDTYLLSGSMLTAGKSITISDAIGANSIQLAPGLGIASSQVSNSALKLNLTNGAAVTVLGADKFSYDVGGNTAAGLDNTDVSFKTFVEGTLKTTVPSSGLSSGAGLVINGTAPATSLASTITGNDFVALQYASPAIVGAGAGNDTYLISSALLPSGTNITVSDALGSNSIQLAGGLSIASSQVTGTALKLTLSTGATVTVLGANNFTYEAGGNTVAGIDQPDVSYASFVQNTLGTTVPASGIASGGAVVLGGSSGIPVQGNNTVNATAANDLFYFDAVTALQDAAGTNTQATIIGFSTTADKLQINLPVTNSAITTLSQLNNQMGVLVQSDPVNVRTLINFGNDAIGGEAVTLTLLGVTDTDLIEIQVIL